MRVLILGGTGAIGIHVCRLLATAGHNVVCTTRRNRKSETNGLSFLEGNAKSPSFLERLLSEHWDAIIDFMVWSTKEFTTHYRSLLAATDQYVFISSYRVYADSTVITESSPRLLEVIDDQVYLATDEYALSKARCEDLLSSSSRSNWTVVRPAITYDRSGRFQLGVYEFATWMWRAAHNIPVPFPAEMLDRQVTMTWGGDVAKMVSLLIGNSAALGEAFTVSTAEHHSWATVAEIYRHVAPLNVSPCTLEEFALANGSIYQIRYDRMLNRVIDNSKILDLTGLTQSSLVTMESGLTNELESCLRSNPKPALTGIGLNARLDRILGGAPSFGSVLRCSPGLIGISKYLGRRLLG